MVTATKDPELRSVPIAKVTPGENIRNALGDLDELAASIGAVGILEPLVVVAHGSRYVVIAGHRRLAAAKKARLAEVPVIVRDKGAAGSAIEIMLIENLQREDLPPTDEAEAFRKLIDDHGYTHKKLGDRVGRSQGHISKRLSLLKLPVKAKEAVDSGGIRMEDALELTKLSAAPTVVNKIVQQAGQGYKVDRLIDREIQELEREKKIAETTAQLQSAGTKIVGWMQGSYGTQKLKGEAVPVRNDSSSWHAHVQMKPDIHAKEPCHASAIDQRSGEAFPVCTKPKNHAEAKAFVPEGGFTTSSGSRHPGKLSDKEKAARKAKRDHNAAVREAEAERWEFLRGLFGRRVAAGHRDAALRFVVEAWGNREVGTSYSAVGRSACELLGVKPSANSYGDRAPLLRLIDRKPDDALRIALAIGIGAFEDGIRMDVGNGWSGSWTRSRPYFAWLKDQGYKASEAERVALSGKAPK